MKFKYAPGIYKIEKSSANSKQIEIGTYSALRLFLFEYKIRVSNQLSDEIRIYKSS